MNFCVNCGKSYSETTLYPIPSSAPELGACAPCLTKYGATVLAEAADEWLAEHFSDAAMTTKDDLKCLHCGGPVVLNGDGSRPLWCMKCHRELQAIRTNK